MNLQALELQKALAQAVANGVREKWERIVVNYEMQTTDEGREVDYCAFYISTADGDFREPVSASWRPPWTICSSS